MKGKKKYVFIIIVLIVVILIFLGKLLLNYRDLKIAYISENTIIQDKSENEIQENAQIEETISSDQNAIDVESIVKEETIKEEQLSQKQEVTSNNNKTITKNEIKRTSNADQEKQQQTNNNHIEETKQSNPPKVETPKENNKTSNNNYTEVEVKIAEKKECDGNNHKIGAGNTGLWFETKAQADNYYNSEIEKWGKLWENDDKFTKEEYLKKCPSGYEVWTCPQCKKWTINFYYR